MISICSACPQFLNQLTDYHDIYEIRSHLNMILIFYNTPDICDMGATVAPCKSHEMTYRNIFNKYDINFVECGTIILWLNKKSLLSLQIDSHN